MINNKEYEELRRDISLLNDRIIRIISIIDKIVDNDLKMANAIKELQNEEEDICLKKASLRDLENF